MVYFDIIILKLNASASLLLCMFVMRVEKKNYLQVYFRRVQIQNKENKDNKIHKR